MIPSCRALLAASLIALPGASAAFAADYEPPLVIDDGGEYVPVEVGSGWYLRGDIGYKFNDTFDDFSFAIPPIYAHSRTDNPLTGSIGFGYHFNDFFRMEANVGLFAIDKERLAYATGIPSAVDMLAQNQMWTGMVNAYADLGTFVGFTPYVGAGVGFAAVQRSFRVSENFADPALVDYTVSSKDTDFRFAYSFGAGVNYKLTDNLSMDVGYEYFASPDARYVAISGPGTIAVRRGVDAHQVKVGLRYDLW